MTIPSGIKNVILDLGGIIINLETDRTWSALKRMAGERWPTIQERAKREDIQRLFETGALDANQYREFFNHHLTEPERDERLDLVFNAMLLNIPGPRITRIKQLGKEYRLFLLSNTNAIHLGQITRDLQRYHQIAGLDDLFEATYYSHIMGLLKPDAAIYQKVLADQGLKAEETLFIDDSQANVDGAIAVGMQALRMDSLDDLD